MTEQNESSPVNDTASESQSQPKVENLSERHKVKIDGEESEVSIEDLKATYQKERSADKKFKDASDLRKQVEQFLEDNRANPKKLLEALGHNPSEFAKNLLLLEIEEEENSKDPNLRRIRELEKRVEAQEKVDAAKKKEAEEAYEAEQERLLVESLDTGIGKALETLGFTAGTAPAEVIADVAEQMLAEYKASKQRLDPNEAFSRAKKSFSRRVTAFTKNKPEALFELLPSEYIEKAVELHLQKKQPKTVPSVKSHTPSTAGAKDDKIISDLNDFFRKK